MFFRFISAKSSHSVFRKEVKYMPKTILTAATLGVIGGEGVNAIRTYNY